MTWNPFKGKDKQDTGQELSQQVPPDVTQSKGRPTPKRKEAQARTLRPLVPKDRKASRKTAKARLRAREDAQYEAMKTGDVAHMPRSERLPWRIYIRDYVDARFNLLEWALPIMIAIIAEMLLSPFISPQYAATVNIIVVAITYAYIIIAIIDTWFMWRSLKRKLIDKFGERSVAKGSRSASYAWQRAMMIRRWRVPKPTKKKRGQWPE